MTRGAGHSGATYIVLMSAVTIFALLQALVIPVLPTIQQELGTDARSVSWVLSAYLMSAAVAIPIVGRVGDVFGKKRVLIAALVLLSLGSLLAAFAPNILVMIIARVIQGAGGAVMPLSLGIVRDQFERERVPRAVGTLAALGGIGAGLGLILAGPIVDLLGYRWLFLAPMLLTVMTVVGAAIAVRPSPGHGGSISWLPAPFLSLALVAFLLATTQATAWGWLDPRTIGLYTASVAFAAIWFWIEHRVPHPLIQPRLLTAPGLRPANLIALLTGFAMFGIYAYVPQFLQTPRDTGYGLGATITESGLVLAPMAAAVFVGGLLTSRLTRAYGPRTVIIAASVVMALGMAVLVVVRSSVWEIAAVLAVYGFALGVNLASLSTAVVLAAAASETAVASAVNFNIRNVGGATGAAAMATIVAADTGADGVPHELGYIVGFIALAVAMVGAALIAMTIPREPPRHGVRPAS